MHWMFLLNVILLSVISVEYHNEVLFVVCDYTEYGFDWCSYADCPHADCHL
jgi:hypothetical protein